MDKFYHYSGIVSYQMLSGNLRYVLIASSYKRYRRKRIHSNLIAARSII